VLPIFAVLAFAVVIASESRRIWHANALYRLPLLSGPLPASRHALTGKLSNGLRYTLVPGNIDPPGRVTSYLHVNAGSLDEDDDQRGMAHFIEHMTFDNSMQFPGRGGGWDHICKTGVAGFNAFTTFRSTTFQLYNFNSSRLDDLFKVYEAQVSGMVPRDEYVRAEAGAILGEARFRNGTTRILSNLVLENHGGSTWRIPHRFTIGVPTQIETFTGSDLARFYSKWYRPDRFHLILAGDFEAKDAEEALARTLGKISTTLAQVEAAGGKDRRDPPPHPAATLPTPRKRLYLTHLPPHREISVHLLITMPPPAPPPFGAPERRRALFSRVFVSLLTLMSHVRMAELYPDLALNALGGRRVSFAIRPVA
jgi:predicted Zn-dependent peptidase